MNRLLSGLIMLAASLPASAEEITYRKHIRPLWEDKCERCHGSSAPYLGAFEENRKAFEADDKGPRMDTYADLLFFVAWPDTGALMRRLDDGSNARDGQPGSMYRRLGRNAEERQANLKLFKQWIGEDAWLMKKSEDVTKEELLRIRAAY